MYAIYVVVVVVGTLRVAHAVTIGRFGENVGSSGPALQPILADLYRLYALTSIEKDLPWFLCHGILTIGQGTGLTCVIVVIIIIHRHHGR
jgi:hypothetical protein